jgi:hypothetical protein
VDTISRHTNGLEVKEKMVMIYEENRNQKRLCWRNQQEFTGPGQDVLFMVSDTM